MTESQTLLADYAGNGSESAFRELVARYIDFVYSAAARLVDGAPHLADDVTQIVFADLARRGSLGREVMLGGWLHRHTCFVAANLMRGERRRQSRERQAAEMNAIEDHSAANLAQIAPILDEAINGLGAADRTAVLLRFFEQRDLRAIGQAMGGNEEAARKRVARALEKLHAILKRRGVTYAAAALATALAARTVTAAPAGLAASVAGSALAAAAAGGGSALTLIKIMAMTKFKIGIVSGMVAASLVTTLVIQQQAQARLRKDDETVQQQANQIAQLRADNERLSRPAARSGNLNTPDELARLRAEAAALRPQTNDLAALREENRQRQKTPAADAEPKSSLRLKAEAITKLSYSKNLILAFFLYAAKNQSQFPTSFEQAASFLGPEATNQSTVTSDQFEIVYQGPMNAVTNPGNVIVLREKQAWQSNGKWSRIYAFADGHCEIHASPDGNFDEWESQHLATPSGQ